MSFPVQRCQNHCHTYRNAFMAKRSRWHNTTVQKRAEQKEEKHHIFAPLPLLGGGQVPAHHTPHGDRESPYQSCIFQTFSHATYCFAARVRWKVGEIQPATLNPKTPKPLVWKSRMEYAPAERIFRNSVKLSALWKPPHPCTDGLVKFVTNESKSRLIYAKLHSHGYNVSSLRRVGPQNYPWLI